ncbi:MAG TPA: nuclear transport factor 2 family protein, partial [Candidatus Limnocylindrales bacterium]
QRRGFRLEAVAPGAVDATRAGLKPMIPEIGAHGIPLRDELTLEVTIGDAPAATASDREALLALELALARRDEASIPGGYDAVLANDFTEVGASGRRWTRDDLIAVLRSEPPNPLVSIVAFDAAEIGPGILLVTYDALGSRSEGGPIDSRRSSIWRRADGRWQLRFNQGTPLPPG